MPANKKKTSAHLYSASVPWNHSDSSGRWHSFPIVIDRAGLHFGKQIESCLCLTTLRWHQQLSHLSSGSGSNEFIISRNMQQQQIGAQETEHRETQTRVKSSDYTGPGLSDILSIFRSLYLSSTLKLQNLNFIFKSFWLYWKQVPASVRLLCRFCCCGSEVSCSL